MTAKLEMKDALRWRMTEMPDDERTTETRDDDAQPKPAMTTPRETFRARKRACAWGTPPRLERAAEDT